MNKKAHGLLITLTAPNTNLTQSFGIYSADTCYKLKVHHCHH